MKTNLLYHVFYRDKNNAPGHSKYLCSSAGVAFAQCQIEHPGARMLKAQCHGQYGNADGHTDFEPPPVQRDPVKEPKPCRLPKPDEREDVMPFYDEVQQHRS